MRRLCVSASSLSMVRKAATSAPSATPSPTKKASIPTTSEKSDASFVGDDIPFSTVSHQLTKLFQARRLVLPACLTMASWALMPAAATSLHWCALATVGAIVQRLSVKGASNSVVTDLTNRVVVLTGGTSGIGLETAVQLIQMNATVCIVCRPERKGPTVAHIAAACADKGLDTLSQRVTFVEADLMDLQQVSVAAQKILREHPVIDVLVNNAGVLAEEPRLSKQGIEEHIAVNFVAPVLLTESLLPQLKKSTHGARVVNVTCSAHVGVRKGNVVNKRLVLKPDPEEGQLTARCYTASKLSIIYYTQYLAARRYEGVQFDKPSSANSSTAARPFSTCTVDPGVVNTSLDRTERLLGQNAFANAFRSLWLKDAREGAQSVVNCVVRPDLENGGHYSECRLMPTALSKMAMNQKEMQEVCRWATHKVEKFLVKS